MGAATESKAEPTALPAHARTLAVFLNARSGAKGGDDEVTELRDALEAEGHTVAIHPIEPNTRIADFAGPIIANAARDGHTVVVVGGDGTVNAIAACCYEHKATFGVLPSGTFNYFARGLNIPTDRAEAIALLGQTHTRHISAGFVQEHLFINNASFGLYPTIIRKREEASSRYGRKRLIAAISAVRSLFNEQKSVAIRLQHEDDTTLHRTSMVFVGNNTLQLQNFGLEVGECTRQDRLAVVILKRLNRLQTARLVWRGIVKNLAVESKLEQFCSDGFAVETRARSIDVAVDGEIVHCATPLAFRIEPDALCIIAPPETEDA